jgi:hypothetical protein
MEPPHDVRRDAWMPLIVEEVVVEDSTPRSCCGVLKF